MLAQAQGKEPDMAKLNRADLRDKAQGFGLLSDPTRLGILSLLATLASSTRPEG